MRSEPPDRGRAPWAGDAGARRLLERVRAACAGEDDLPTRLEAGLRAALTMLAAEPDVAYQLTVAPYLESDEDSFVAQQAWMARFGELLGDAGLRDPRAQSPGVRFLGTFLVGSVRFQIARLVLNGEGSDLLRLLPGTLEVLLAYYFEPGEPPRLARAALENRRAA